MHVRWQPLIALQDIIDTPKMKQFCSAESSPPFIAHVKLALASVSGIAPVTADEWYAHFLLKQGLDRTESNILMFDDFGVP